MNTSEPNPAELVRVSRAERRQSEWREFSLEQFIRPDDRVRIVWRYVESLDLSPLYAEIKALPGKAGRDAVDPKILVALWLFATIDGVGSARRIDRLCQRDLAYMWICGGVSVNYHLLSDFRTAHPDFLQKILTSSVASLMHAGIVTLETVAQDGVRVRANAGSSSFRRKPSLENCLEVAQKHVQALQEAGDGDGSAKQQAAQERAAREQLERAEQALQEVVKLQAEREKRKAGTGEEARCSTTDPEARKMKMGDGGFRPAYNVQVATDGDSRVIVGVSVTNSGNDGEQMAPMQARIVSDYGKAPGNYLVDCGYPGSEQVTQVEKNGSRVHAPIHGEAAMLKRGSDPYARKSRDTDESFAFRTRMAGEAAQELYKQRPSIAEFVNAELRNRGLTQFRVRGLEKVGTVTLWYAIGLNLIRMIDLGVFG